MTVIRMFVAVSVAAFSWSLIGQHVCGVGASSRRIVKRGASINYVPYFPIQEDIQIVISSQNRIVPAAGSPKCTFPFYWKGMHYTCTTHDRELPWCAVELSPGTSEPVSSIYCNHNWERDPYLSQMSPTVPPGGGISGLVKDCKFPFVWKNIEYHSCTTADAEMPWCATKLNGDVTREPVASMYCKDPTTGVPPYKPPPTIRPATREGSLCVFPFVHKGVAYHKCTSVDADAPWCAISTTAQGLALLSDFCKYESDENLSTSYVQPPSFSARKAPSCNFPFLWKGTNYHSCTTADRERPWCAVEVNIGSMDPVSSMYCNYSWERDPYPAMMSPTTREGTLKAVNMDKCIFPFVWSETVYTNCTTKESEGPWCALEVTEDTRKPIDSAYCTELLPGSLPSGMSPRVDPVTVKGPMCIFPFVYKGVAYHKCTSVDAFASWCPYIVTVEGFPVQTDYCRYPLHGAEPPKTPTPTYTGGKVRMKCIVPFNYKGTKYNGCTKDHSSFPWCAGNVDEDGEAVNIIPCNTDTKRTPWPLKVSGIDSRQNELRP